MGMINQITPDGSLTYSRSGTPINAPEIETIPGVRNAVTMPYFGPGRGGEEQRREWEANQIANGRTVADGNQSIGTSYKVGGKTFKSLADAQSYRDSLGGFTGDYVYTDPYTGKTYRIPTYTATTSLSEMGQQIKGQNDQTQLNLAETGAAQSAFLKDYLGEIWNPDTSAIEGRLMELGSQRLDPRFQQEEDRLRTRLANQGVTAGSEAWNREMASLGQSKNDAYNQLMLQGRGQAFSELQAQRNQPINEISALLSGSQVSNPSVQMAQPQGMATTDVAGLINSNYNQRLQGWQQQQAQKQSLLGGLFGLGAAGITGGLFG